LTIMLQRQHAQCGATRWHLPTVQTAGRRPVRCRASSAKEVAQPEWRRPALLQPPYHVVITGSTKGIGRALAAEFLRAGDTVMITSRSEEAVKATVTELGNAYGKERVHGLSANVSVGADVRALADYAKERMGRVDMWINNAGSNGYTYKPLLESDDAALAEIVGTNVLGVMLCCKEAIRIMSTQSAGHVFNMDGAGASGSATPRFAAYGATKRSLAQLGASLQAELGQANVPVCVHNLSPGMVTTELLMSGADTPTAKFFINTLAEEAETVAQWLVPRVRQVPQAPTSLLSGRLNPTYIQYLTTPKAFTQIAQRLIFGTRKARFVPEP